MLNKVIIIGRASADATANEKGTASKVRVLVNESYKDSEGNKQERTEGFTVVAFGKLSEIFAQYVKKGGLVSVVGSQRTRSYEKDGETKYVTEVIASELSLLSGKSEGKTQGDAAAPAPAPAAAGSDDEEIGF